jgi:hypothetical protein
MSAAEEEKEKAKLNAAPVTPDVPSSRPMQPLPVQPGYNTIVEQHHPQFMPQQNVNVNPEPVSNNVQTATNLNESNVIANPAPTQIVEEKKI